jgi:protein-S-isoprenylcysteine O-methyltransferase Ste14
VAQLLLAGSLVVWIGIEVRQGLRRRPEATSRDRGSLNVLRFLVAAGVVLAALVSTVTAFAYPYSSVVLAVSFAFIWLGIALRWWSFRTLGRYFTFTVMTSPDQPVIMTGPYRVLRHPSYTGLLLILFGFGVGYGNWVSLAALTLLPLVGFINRIRVEEAALEAALGTAYTSYAMARKRLVPLVW